MEPHRHYPHDRPKQRTMTALENRASRQSPARVALVEAPASAQASALLDDAAEALPVYAWLAKTEAPEIVRARPGTDVTGCDTVLLALAAGTVAPDADGELLGSAAAGTRVYALVCVDDDPGAAADALAALRERCEARGLAWLGGLAIGDAGLLPRMACRPRMGWARRRVSEAVDQLLIALLAGQPFGEQCVRPSRYARLTCHPH